MSGGRVIIHRSPHRSQMSSTHCKTFTFLVAAHLALWQGYAQFRSGVDKTIVHHQGYQIGYALKFMTNSEEAQKIHLIPRHEGLVKYYGAFPYKQWTGVGMELCWGNLKEYLRSPLYQNLSVDEQRIKRWEMLCAIAGGLEACHVRGIMHRDIKPENSMPSFAKLI
jgi:serine/threonine protein kinase